MQVKIHPSWNRLLQSEFEQCYFRDLIGFVKEEYDQYSCYPKSAEIFAAFDHCAFEELKVVIIGQDPYHGPNQADGLCFSVQDGIPHPPSLLNIFKEIVTDMGTTYPKSGNLKRWAEQGVLLLNVTLTVRAHEPGSHQKQGWETFTDAVIKKISEGKNPVVFLFWGGFAKKKAKLIDSDKHYILTSGHPSPLSANRGFWFGNQHFSNCNKILIRLGNKSVTW